MSYQWRFNGTDIGGATSDSLVIASVVVGDAGLYSVVVTNGSGSVPSADAALLLDTDEDGLAVFGFVCAACPGANTGRPGHARYGFLPSPRAASQPGIRGIISMRKAAGAAVE